MTVHTMLCTTAIALAFGVFIGVAPTPAAANHCYHLSSGMIYCYDTRPTEVSHASWNVDQAPFLPEGYGWECNLMSHPRTICVSYDLDEEPPTIPKYVTDE